MLVEDKINDEQFEKLLLRRDDPLERLDKHKRTKHQKCDPHFLG